MPISSQVFFFAYFAQEDMKKLAMSTQVKIIAYCKLVMLLPYFALCSIQLFLIEQSNFLFPLLRYYSTRRPHDHLNVLSLKHNNNHVSRRRRFPRQYHLRRRILNRQKLASDTWFVHPYEKQHRSSQTPSMTSTHHQSPTQSPHDESIAFTPSDLSITSLCSSVNFLDIHRITTMFDNDFLPMTLRRKISDDLNNIRHICYSNSHETFSPSYATPHNVFLNRLDQHSLPIVLDSGASRSISPVKSDFVSLRKCKDKINGINSTTQVEGIGKMRLKIIDEQNQTAIIETEGYYIPSLSIRLYSPQNHFKELNDTSSLPSPKIMLH